jgi:predicted N-acetyltransferase YhbS
MHAFSNATMKARQEVFMSRYEPNQMSLRQMVTHPHYWGCGAGHLLVDWGVKQPTEKEVAIVMFSSPMGKALYETFGFRELAKLHIPVELPQGEFGRYKLYGLGDGMDQRGTSAGQ